MRGKDIKQKIKQFPILKSHFEGVFAIDTIPHFKKTSFAIINTDLSGSKGVHWVAIYLSPHNSLEVFDSAAEHFEAISEALKKVGNYNIIHNTAPYQKFGTKSCGLFCIYFILNRILNLETDFYDILNNIFSSNLDINEDIIKEFKTWIS